MLLIVSGAKGLGTAETGDFVNADRLFAAETALFDQAMAGLLAGRASAEVLEEDSERFDFTPSVFVQVVVADKPSHGFSVN